MRLAHVSLLGTLIGAGIGLSADEVGLLFLGVPYGSLVSLLVPLGVGIGLLVGASNAIRRDDAHEFLVLDRNDVLTIAGVLLSLVGVLYLDRPLNPDGGVHRDGIVEPRRAAFRSVWKEALCADY